MKNVNKKHGFTNNFKNDKGENRKALRNFILTDKEWVQAFLQAQLDIRKMNSQKLLNSVAF